MSGLTITSADRQAGPIRESHIQKSRSAVVKPRSLHGPLHDAQLVTERQDLELQSRAAAEHQDDGREEGGEHATG